MWGLGRAIATTNCALPPRRAAKRRPERALLIARVRSTPRWPRGDRSGRVGGAPGRARPRPTRGHPPMRWGGTNSAVSPRRASEAGAERSFVGAAAAGCRTRLAGGADGGRQPLGTARRVRAGVGMPTGGTIATMGPPRSTISAAFV